MPTRAQVKAEAAATCGQSFLSAFSGVFSGLTLKEGVEATVAELRVEVAALRARRSDTMARRPPTIRLNRVDFPALV